MKSIRTIATFVFLLGSFYSIKAPGTAVNDFFTKANKEYHDKDYQEAISDYLKIARQNYRSPELYFNLGNCYYKTDSIGLAILYYEKARRLTPSDKDIALNLQLANLKVTDKIEPMNDFILVIWWHNIARSFTVDTWSFWAILLLWFGLAGLLLFFFGASVESRKAGFFSGTILLISSVILFVITFSRYHYDTTQRFGVVLSSSVHVMSEPDEQSKELFVLHEGVKVRLLSSVDNYKNIELPDGKQGWVEGNAVAEI